MLGCWCIESNTQLPRQRVQQCSHKHHHNTTTTPTTLSLSHALHMTMMLMMILCWCHVMELWSVSSGGLLGRAQSHFDVAVFSHHMSVCMCVRISNTHAHACAPLSYNPLFRSIEKNLKHDEKKRSKKTATAMFDTMLLNLVTGRLGAAEVLSSQQPFP